MHDTEVFTIAEIHRIQNTGGVPQVFLIGTNITLGNVRTVDMKFEVDMLIDCDVVGILRGREDTLIRCRRTDA